MSRCLVIRRVAIRTRGAFILLEVVLALSLLLLAMGVVGLAFNNGQHDVERAERMSRAMLLTERLLAQIDSGAVSVWPSGDAGQPPKEFSGSFPDESMPGMSWSVVAAQDPQVAGLVDLSINIYIGSADAKSEDRDFVLATHVLRAVPQAVDFERDFGMTAEQAGQITEAIPGGEAVFNPHSFDPRSLASMDLDTISKMLPMIMAAFGGQINPAQFDQIIKAVQSGDMSQIQGLLQQSGIGQGLPGQVGAPPTGGNPPPNQPGQQPPPGQQPRRQGGKR